MGGFGSRGSPLVDEFEHDLRHIVDLSSSSRVVGGNGQLEWSDGDERSARLFSLGRMQLGVTRRTYGSDFEGWGLEGMGGGGPAEARTLPQAVGHFGRGTLPHARNLAGRDQRC